MQVALIKYWKKNTLNSTAVPAPETANKPTARRAWDQWNRESLPIVEKLPLGAAAAGCIVWTGAWVWIFDDGFDCPPTFSVWY